MVYFIPLSNKHVFFHSFIIIHSVTSFIPMYQTLCKGDNIYQNKTILKFKSLEKSPCESHYHISKGKSQSVKSATSILQINIGKLRVHNWSPVLTNIADRLSFRRILKKWQNNLSQNCGWPLGSTVFQWWTKTFDFLEVMGSSLEEKGFTQKG